MLETIITGWSWKMTSAQFIFQFQAMSLPTIPLPTIPQFCALLELSTLFPPIPTELECPYCKVCSKTAYPTEGRTIEDGIILMIETKMDATPLSSGRTFIIKTDYFKCPCNKTFIGVAHIYTCPKVPQTF